jgi:hypothetical protein
MVLDKVRGRDVAPNDPVKPIYSRSSRHDLEQKDAHAVATNLPDIYLLNTLHPRLRHDVLASPVKEPQEFSRPDVGLTSELVQVCYLASVEWQLVTGLVLLLQGRLPQRL